MHRTTSHRASSRRHATPTVLALALVGVALLVGAGSLLTACSSNDTSAATSASPAAAGPITVTDDAGKTVTLDKPAERVVSIAPANTEIAFALGAGDKVVGDTTYCDYPEQAKAIDKIGDFSNPSMEKIVALEPDLVLVTGGIQKNLPAKLEKLGIAVYSADPTNLEALYSDLQEMGDLMGVSENATKLVDDMQTQVDAVSKKVEGAETPKTFLEIYGKPLMTAGTGTFIDDLINKAGGVNVGATAGEGFPEFNAEKLIEEDPAVYVAVKGSQSDPGAIAARPGYSQLTAVTNGAVYVIDDNLVTRPGPRLVLGLQQLAQMIHPELFGSPSPEASPAP
jgi:iron complex transport system substrate-binding protein